MVDRKRDIAGSCDVILQHKDTGMLCLADFKTQEIYKKKNHSLQMGGYVSLLYQNYPTVDLWSCRVIYITPDGIKTQDYNPQECMYDYEEARSIYFSKKGKILVRVALDRCIPHTKCNYCSLFVISYVI